MPLIGATDDRNAANATARWWQVIEQISLFSSLTSQDAACLDEAEELQLSDGDVLIAEGSLPGPFFIVVAGSLYATRRLNHRDAFFMRFETGSYFGHELILLGTPYQATARSEGASVVLRLGETAFWQMLQDCPSVNQALLRTTAERARTLEAIAQHDARMAALNKLAAGLAHELNNPAAALARCGSSLREAGNSQITSLSSFLALGLPSETALRFLDLLQTLSASTPKGSPDPAEEDAWVEELDAIGCGDLTNLSAALALSGCQPNTFDWLRPLHRAAQRAGLELLDSTLAISRQGEHVRNCSKRISKVVNGIKSYAVLDQESVQTIDVSASVEHALSA